MIHDERSRLEDLSVRLSAAEARWRQSTPPFYQSRELLMQAKIGSRRGIAMTDETEAYSKFKITPTMNDEQIRLAAIAFADQHRAWYENQSDNMGNIWNYVTFATIVLSALSSVLVAYNLSDGYRWIPALLSALAAFCAAFLTQFRVRDLWQIREAGRIDAEKLVAKAQLLGLKQSTYAVFHEAVSLRHELHDLERDQTQQFFAIPKSSTVNSPTPATQTT